MARKPSNIGHEESAAIRYGSVLATHIMRRDGIQTGRKVLVYGASGAIGTTAVQLAKCCGAQVTGVCSSRNFESEKSLGADDVIDYTTEDCASMLETHDFVLDAVGEKKSSELKAQCRKALHHNGKHVSVDDGSVKLRSEYLDQLREFVEAGNVKAVIDRRYPLEQMVEAHRYGDKGHIKGNVVITLEHNNRTEPGAAPDRSCETLNSGR